MWQHTLSVIINQDLGFRFCSMAESMMYIKFERGKGERRDLQIKFFTERNLNKKDKLLVKVGKIPIHIYFLKRKF